MRVLWTLFKIIIGLAIAIPAGVLVLALTAGVLGALVGLAVLALKLACLGLVGYGLFALGRRLFGSAPKQPAQTMRELPNADPYYQAAMRDLDAELGGQARR